MSVEEHWRRLNGWCQREAPVTAAAIDPPAPVDVLKSVETFTGRTWPAELRTWFGLQNGNPDGGHSAMIFPEFQPLPLARVASVWESMTTEWGETTTAVGGIALPDQPAGTVADTFLAAYIPIAANIRGDLLFVDTRTGQASGCVREFLGDSADQGTTWPSVAALLEDVVFALEHGQPCGGWIPSVDQGWLSWDLP